MDLDVFLLNVYKMCRGWYYMVFYRILCQFIFSDGKELVNCSYLQKQQMLWKCIEKSPWQKGEVPLLISYAKMTHSKTVLHWLKDGLFSCSITIITIYRCSSNSSSRCNHHSYRHRHLHLPLSKQPPQSSLLLQLLFQHRSRLWSIHSQGTCLTLFHISLSLFCTFPHLRCHLISPISLSTALLLT